MISVKLPILVEELNRAWANIPMGQLSGLAPINLGGPQDNCMVNGAWSPTLQAAHGGPIPMMTGAPNSRGMAEEWPYNKARWTQVGHGNWEKVEGHSRQMNPGGINRGLQKAEANWAEMDWRSNQCFDA